MNSELKNFAAKVSMLGKIDSTWKSENDTIFALLIKLSK